MTRPRPEDSRFSLTGINFEEADGLVSQSPVLFRYTEATERAALDFAGGSSGDLTEGFLTLLSAIRKTAHPRDQALTTQEETALSQAGMHVARQLAVFREASEGEGAEQRAQLAVETHTLYNNVEVMHAMIAARSRGKS